MATRAARSKRIEARIDPESEQRIAEAAALTNQSISSFVVGAARAEADRVLARADIIFMPTQQFDALLGSLDEPDEAPVLARVAAAGRRRVLRTARLRPLPD
jgi:uncharacterized protein (DUF1778 family)